MKEFNGTPGPWRVLGKSTPARVDGGNLIIAFVGEEDLGCKLTGDDYLEQREVESSNAKLIAAAPELLEALQFTIHDVGHWLSTQKPELKEKIESAINKALGE